MAESQGRMSLCAKFSTSRRATMYQEDTLELLHRKETFIFFKQMYFCDLFVTIVQDILSNSLFFLNRALFHN